MEAIAAVELIGAVYAGIMLICLLVDGRRIRNRMPLAVCNVLAVLWLTTDALTYILNGPQTPYPVLYALHLATYLLSSVVVIGFFGACSAWLQEKTKLDSWVFRLPVLLTAVNMGMVAAGFIEGNLTSYSDGVFAVTGDLPVTLLLNYVILLCYAPAVAFAKRHEIGLKPVMQLTAFVLPLVAAVLLILLTGDDYSVLLGAGSVMILVSLMKNDMTQAPVSESPDSAQPVQRQEEENTGLMDSLLRNYNAVERVCLSDASYVILKADGEIAGKDRVFDSFPAAREFFLQQVVYPADRDMLARETDLDTVRRKLASVPSYAVEYRMVSRGLVLWCELTVSALGRDEVAFAYAVRDTEILYRHIRTALTDTYEGIQVIDLDNDKMKILKEGGVMMDPPLTLRYSQALSDFSLGLRGEARGYYEAVADPEYAKRMLQKEGRTEYFYQFANRDGWYRRETHVLAWRGGLPETLVALTSLTDSLQQEKMTLNARLRDALEEAKAANESRSRFLFNMSHDIRTPMNAILGFTAMAQKYADNPAKVTECLNKTRQSGNLLLSLINSVLDVSRIESGDVESEEEPGDVYFSFATLEPAMREAAAVKKIALAFDFGGITDRWVYADFNRCVRILTNLISNAITYTEAGGSVSVRCEQATPAAEGIAYYRYTVRDTGIGMSEEFQKHMYEAFTREQNSTASGIQGSGLGLNVVMTFVRYLRGTIACDSKPGKGTCFTVTLPFRIQYGQLYTDPVTGARMNAATEAGEPASLAGKRVLLVEDNEMNRDIARDILEEEGLTVDEAVDGSVAVDRLREKGPAGYDFILMDIQMPVMNGYEAAKAIRDMYPDAGIPIIAVSANALEEDRKASAAAGMNEHLAKPIRVDELLETLKKYLK